MDQYYNIESLQKIPIGRQGENSALVVKINVQSWVKEYPNAQFYLTVLRPAEKTPYFAETVFSNGILSWSILAADVGIAGIGSAEIRAVEGNVVKKSKVFQIIIDQCLPGTASDIPPVDAPSWVDQILDSRAEDFEIDTPTGHLIVHKVDKTDKDLGQVIPYDALAGKVDKLTDLEEKSAVYVGNPDGTQTHKYLDNNASGDSVPLRDADANIHVGDATQTGHAVSLGMALTLIREQIGRVYKPAGSITFAELINSVDLDEGSLGNIYNIKNAFTTTNSFIEGAGISYPAGTNVGVVEINNTYYFDVFVGQVDLSNYYTKQEVDSIVGEINTVLDSVNGVVI